MPDLLYRFRGRVEPHAGIKTPIRASTPSTSSDDGVATLRLYDPIDSWGGWWGVSAKEFVEALDEVSDAREIRLHINSPGGEVYEAVAILNALRRHPARVVSVVDGIAASAASVIAVGVDETVMGRNAELMMHDAWGVGIGPAQTMRDLAERLDKLSNNIASIYAGKAGGDVDAWRDLMLAETWYTSEEAVAAKLADRVEGDTDDDPDGGGEASAAWDLAGFRYQGRAAAPPPRMPHTEQPPPAPDRPAAPTAHREHVDRVMRAYQTRYRLPAGS